VCADKIAGFFGCFGGIGYALFEHLHPWCFDGFEHAGFRFLSKLAN